MHGSPDIKLVDDTSRPAQTGEGLASAVRDRTETEEALRESEARYRQLFDSVSDGIVVTDLESRRFEAANPAALRLYGYTVAELFARRVEDLSAEPEKTLARLQQLAQQPPGSGLKTLRRVRRKDGTIFDAEITGRTFLSKGRLKLITSFRDVTERKELERMILEASSREQRRIGQDLHDSVCQQLTGITFLCKTLTDRLAARSAPEAVAAAEVGHLVSQALAETQHLARGLCPVDLEIGKLVEALESLAISVQRLFGISCRVECNRPVVTTEPVAALHLYRIAQEAITNAVRHGQAQRVWIELIHKPDATTLSIEDDGRGFVAPPAGGKGMGLRIMNYRAAIIGGEFAIRRKSDAGGTIVACVVRNGRAEEGDGAR